MITEAPALIERPKSPLRYLLDTQISIEKLRIGMGNRVSAMTLGVDENAAPVPSIYERLHTMANDMEAEVDKAIAAELRAWPVYEAWLSHVRGIGPALAGQMLAFLLPPIPTKGPSSWYKAAGLAPEERADGYMRLPRARAGEGTITYHPYLRRCLHNVATSFVRNGGYYRTVYEERKARLQELHRADTEHWPPHRIESTCRWQTIKFFLSHLWEAWCEEEGIERRPAYVIEQLGHQYIHRPMPEGKKKI